MQEVILIKYGEIALKGLNKRTFENILAANIKRRLKPIGRFELTKMQSTIYCKPLDSDQDVDLDAAVDVIKHIFGIAALERCLVLPKDFGEIVRLGIPYLEDVLQHKKTFKIEAKRSDKTFPMKTPDIQRELGYEVLQAYKHISVDVHNPDVTVTLEIRDTNAYLHYKRIIGAGGMPVGSSGKSLLLLSGGIDSPVAGYMLAKRGVRVSAVHFISPPYTSERALVKVEKLCKKMSVYLGDIKLFVVNLTDIQEAIRDNCPEEFLTIITRRMMTRIACVIAAQNKIDSLITGENIAQVASQTMKALACTDDVADRIIFRPLIGFDKIEIVDAARRINTYDTSILPYEDCCTVFTPKHPKTKPVLTEIRTAEERYDFAPLIDRALETVVVKMINMGDNINGT